MDKQNLMPQVAQPVNRFTTGQLPAELAELSEEALQLHGDNDSASVLASSSAMIISLLGGGCAGQCSYGGDDAE